MAVVTSYGSRICNGLLNSASPSLADPGEGGGMVRKWVETFETSAADSTDSVYTVARLPSNARIFGTSKIYWDQLGSTTTKLDIGVYKVNAGQSLTDDPDAINDGLVTSSAGSSALIKDISNYGKRLWEYANGQTVDPRGQLDVKVILTDANLSSGAGTVTVEIDYALD